MEISQYQVGQIPARPISIDVRDSEGRPMNLSSYTGFKVIILGSDNEVVDLTGSSLASAQAAAGKFLFRFPTDRSIFNKPGQYLLQLELTGPGSRDFTTEHHIKVRKFGGVK